MRNITQARILERNEQTQLTRRVFMGALLFGGAGVIFGQGDSGRSYKTGYSHIMKLGRDLHAALQQKQRARIAVQPISIETDHRPFAKLLSLKDGTKEVRGVWISAGFIDLVNHVAHAQAIDRKVKGYFERYMELLEDGGVPPLPQVDEARYWSDEVLKEQQSNFNSIVGAVVGMKLANHYLGQYDKYKEEGGEAGIDAVMSVDEWREAFRHGVWNALRAGCMTEGAAPFFGAMDRMKARPPWVQNFIHPKARIANVRREMEQAQQQFLAGEDGPEGAPR